jgi:hypothetical protein
MLTLLLSLAVLVLSTPHAPAAAAAPKLTRKAEIRLVACDVCHLAIDHIHGAARGLGDEDKIVETVLDKVCDPSTAEGLLWKSIDIVDRAAAAAAGETQTPMSPSTSPLRVIDK